MKLAFLQLLITVMIAANNDSSCHAFQLPSLLPPLKFFITDSTTATVAKEPIANKANIL